MMRRKLPALRAVRSPGPSWRATALALATALTFGLTATDAQALALGRLTVQSTLGEPLRAEIDIPEITAEEAASLRAAVASPEAFRAAGTERHPALADLQVSLQQRPDGRYVLRLSSPRAVTEPFVDLILEATWAAGRIVRDYSLLFDPPANRQAAAPAPLAPQLGGPAAEPAPAAPAGAAAPLPPAPATQPATPAPASAGRVTVRRGDTAAAIAAARKPPTVSLDQMLVALLRANPDAFVRGNVNRLKAGAVLDLPTEAQASAVDAAQARQSVVAQSRDFNEFRRRLAERATQGPAIAQSPSRQATGRLEAQVDDKRPTETTPDRLQLSKGAVEGRIDPKAAEERIARERAAQDAATRLAELNRNIAELNRLGAASTAAGGAGAAAAASAPASPGIAVAAGTPSEPAASAAPAASVPASAPAPEAAASASPPAPVAAAPAPTASQRSRSLLDTLLDNPVIPAAATGLLAALVGLVVLLRRRADAADEDSGFNESRLAPDAFPGDDEPVDARQAAGGARSSMVYSPSQLDAAGDVDPVAEADVYLAYGRDLQAEEILKEALRANPQRLAIHAKLLEIYAKRHDVGAFEPLALEARRLTQGLGPEWAHIAQLGQDLDPANPLYQSAAAAAGLTTQPDELPPADRPLDLNLDEIDLELPQRSAQRAAPQEPRLDPLDDLGGLGGLPPAAPPPPPAAPTLPQALADLDLDIPSFAPGGSPPPAPAPAPVAGADTTRAAPPSGGLIDFDLSGISLDLEPSAARGGESDVIDPLATKLALAEECAAIGDTYGARALASEVLAEAAGPLRQRAQRLLDELG